MFTIFKFKPFLFVNVKNARDYHFHTIASFSPTLPHGGAPDERFLIVFDEFLTEMQILSWLLLVAVVVIVHCLNGMEVDVSREHGY